MVIEMEVGRLRVWKRSHNGRKDVAPKTSSDLGAASPTEDVDMRFADLFPPEFFEDPEEVSKQRKGG